MQSAATSILKRGVELDKENRLQEALVCYQEGIQLLINMVKKESGLKATYIRRKIEEYMNRAEIIKRKVEKLKDDGKYHQQVQIEEDSTGHGYESVFGSYLDADVAYVIIEDPYIRAFHQCQNLTRMLEVFVKRCPNFKTVKLITTRIDDKEQQKFLNQIDASLREIGVRFILKYEDGLHDRQIELSNGWIIKIGRGLDYFKAPTHKLGIGAFDMDLRKCHKTTVDIFHSNTVKQL